MNTMSYKGFKAQIMRAERLTGNHVHELPPGSAIDIYPVDVFQEPLSHWITGAGNYVVPVDSDWGLWFDWRLNDSMNTAVLPSIKGMNPITGRRTNGFMLERYSDSCPEHGEKFKDGNFCEKCNFKWPDQNYITYPNTLWWDGFRTTDGKVRQFFFTEELSRSIPELVIGKEDTVPAFGFAFFRPKVARQPTVASTRGFYFGTSSPSGQMLGSNIGCKYGSSINHVYYSNSSNMAQNSEKKYMCLSSKLFKSSLTMDSCLTEMKTSGDIICSNDNTPIAVSAGPCAASVEEYRCFDESSDIKKLKQELTVKQRLTKKKLSEVGIGAGAEINQSLVVDTLKLDDWQNEPASVMRLYFIFIDQFNEIKNKGIKNLVGEKEGYLSNLPVG